MMQIVEKYNDNAIKTPVFNGRFLHSCLQSLGALKLLYR